jgi:hypothetical protein
MNSFMYWALFADVVPQPPGAKPGGFEFRANFAFYMVATVAVLAVIAAGVLLLRLLRREPKEVDPDAPVERRARPGASG